MIEDFLSLDAHNSISSTELAAGMFHVGLYGCDQDILERIWIIAEGFSLKQGRGLLQAEERGYQSSKAILTSHSSQTLPTRSMPGFRVFLPGFQPEGVASAPPVSLTN